MVLGAGPWYTSAASSTILSAAGVLAVVVIGVLSFWLLRLPLRRLLLVTIEAKSLIADPSGALRNSQLQVIYAGQPMATPYLVAFSLTSKSRTDIRRGDFDGDRSLVFDFGTPVALLASTVPGNQDNASDWFRVDGSRILVGPQLIRRGQSISLSLLTSEPARLEYQNSIAGVTLQEKREADARRRRAAATIPVIAALLLATNLTTGLLSHYLTSSGKASHLAGPSQPASTPPAVRPTGPDMSLVGSRPGQPRFQSATTILSDPTSGGIHAVAYSSNSRYLAAADGNGNFYIWNTATKKLAHDPIHDPNSLGIYAVSFSQDGTQFATGDGNGHVYLWSTTFTLTDTFRDRNSGGIRAVAFSPDGKFLAAADTNGTVFVWNLTTRRAEPQPDPHSFGVAAVAFSSDNSYLVAGDSNGHVFRWAHTEKGDEHVSGSVAVRALAFSKDGKYLAVGDLNGNTYIWATATWTVVSTPAVQATCGINGVAFSPDSKYLATADCDGHLYLWANMLSSTPPSPIAQSAAANFQQTGSLTAVAFSPDGKSLAAGSSNGYLYEWNAHF